MSLDLNLLTYNALDAACTAEVWDAVHPDIDRHGYRWTYDFTMKLYQPLIFMQKRGIKVNFTNLEETKDAIQRKQATLQEELNKLCGRDLNANSPKQVAEYFYRDKGVGPYYNKEGGITTDDKALQRIARGTAKRPGMREARLVQDIRGLQKLFGTYLDIDFDSDGRLRCAYNPRGTKFGRLSSSATVFGTGTNLQNLPPEFKKFLVADDGYFFWEVDKRQAEWVVVAYLSGDANMISVIESGEDPHVHTAHLMFRVDKEIIFTDHDLVKGLTDPDELMRYRTEAGIPPEIIMALPRTMSGRQMGKKSNHGLNYDEGYNTFALSNEIEIAESKRTIALYHGIYPGIRLWHEATKRQLGTDRTLTNCFGRKIRFLDAWGDDLFKAAYSAIPQSTVGDVTNSGMCAIYEDGDLTSPEGENIDILAQVHDSLLMQVPIAALDHGFDKIMQKVYDYMEPELEYNGRRFKIATDSKVGYNWGGFHKTENVLGMKELKTAAEIREHILGQRP